MKISFFEEFPTKKNLAKLKLVNWPTKIYLAASSLKEFNEIKVGNAVYWPILKKKEGYWISPFSQRKALKRVFSELEGKRVPVMLDLELPTTKNPWLYFTQKINFLPNKSLIKDFIDNYKGQVYLAEYYPEGKTKEKLLQWFGLHYQNKKVKIIKMLYHSLHYFNEKFLRNELSRGKKEFGNNYLLALGTIATGINGNEPLLSLKQLKKDLHLAQEYNIKEVVIFRLGGLNLSYKKILKEYNSQ